MATPSTSTATSHGISIRVNNQTLGMIQSWVPSQNRPATAVYELNAASSGKVIEQVPGNLGGLTLTVTRYDLFKSRMESIWGFNMVMLTDQVNPIEIREKFEHPDGTVEVDVYMGCWFTSLGRNIAATGDRLINVNAQLVYKDKKRIL